jgi:SOS response regulatory protein OraA/RecX
MSRIYSNTPISELTHYDDPLEEALMHGADIRYVDLDEDELFHWKYVKRVKLANGKWRYYYDWDGLKKDVKNTVDDIKDGAKKAVDSAIKKAQDTALKVANSMSKSVDKAVTKGRNVLTSLYNDPKNMYDVNSQTYSDKMSKIKDSKEWKDIVARNDPEYVVKNKDGTTTYKIDKYVVDKKHPVLDALGDIVAGRKVDTNEITKESVVAGLKDYAIGTIRSGMMTVGIATTFLTEKFKLQQGTYDEQINELVTTASRGADYVNSVLEQGQQTVTDVRTAAKNTGVTQTDVEKLVRLASNMRSTSDIRAAASKAGVTEDDVEKLLSTASQIANSQSFKEAVKKLGLKEDDIRKLTNAASYGHYDINKTLSDAGITKDSIEDLLSKINNQTNASSAKTAIDEGNVIRAAQLIVESDAMKSAAGDNEYYKLAESVLANLSPAEIEAVNLLIKQLRS